MASLIDGKSIPSVTDSKAQFAQIKWGRVLVGGILPHVGWNVALPLLVVLGDEPSVATWLPALSNPGLVGPFGVWGVPILTIALAGVMGVLVGRTVDEDLARFHGLLVGLLAAIIGLAFGLFAVVFVLTTISGWVGGRISHGLT